MVDKFELIENKFFVFTETNKEEIHKLRNGRKREVDPTKFRIFNLQRRCKVIPNWNFTNKKLWAANAVTKRYSNAVKKKKNISHIHTVPVMSRISGDSNKM